MKNFPTTTYSNEITFYFKYDLAEKVSDLADVDGVNVENMTVTTVQDKNQEKFNVTITVFGYSKPKGGSGSIVISGEPDYKIIASATAEYTINGLTVDLDTVQIDSILKVFDADDFTNFKIHSVA